MTEILENSSLISRAIFKKYKKQFSRSTLTNPIFHNPSHFAAPPCVLRVVISGSLRYCCLALVVIAHSWRVLSKTPADPKFGTRDFEHVHAPPQLTRTESPPGTHRRLLTLADGDQLPVWPACVFGLDVDSSGDSGQLYPLRVGNEGRSLTTRWCGTPLLPLSFRQHRRHPSLGDKNLITFLCFFWQI